MASEMNREGKKSIVAPIDIFTAISSPLLGSSSNDRSRSLAMKFHRKWRHPDCPVERWYQQQKSSSTEFTTIRHCRNTGGPFFHEFLIIPLLDGAICRLERMGEDSHANAIRRIGCISHDIIQWFSASGYESNPISKQPFELIAEITFPRTFDLLDILAICHTIHHSPRCSVYTLQRYNCYFLCLTVMNILARRVPSWGNVIDSQATWSNIVETAIDQLHQYPCNDPHEESVLGKCALLDPNHPNPRTLILSRLCDYISATGFEPWKIAVSETLWIGSWEQLTKHGLEQVVSKGVYRALKSHLRSHSCGRSGIMALLPDYGVWKHSLLECIISRIHLNLQTMKLAQVEHNSDMLRLTKLESPELVISIEVFQEHIHKRIHAHATRVAALGLGSADLVGVDIVTAMEELWERLPSGYGGRIRQTG